MVSRAPLTRTAAWLLVASLLLPPHTSSDPRPKDWNPSINPADFVGVVDNQYFPLPSGRKLLYRTGGGGGGRGRGGPPAEGSGVNLFLVDADRNPPQAGQGPYVAIRSTAARTCGWSDSTSFTR